MVGESWAAKVPSGLTSVGPESTGSPTPLKSLNADTFTLPQELGYIQEISQVPNANKTVIHIQDAHCNYAAQRSISGILNYLTTAYGIYAVNCEGGAEDYDLTPFTIIPEKDIREKTSDFFVKEGVVSAAEYFAVNNPDKVKLWGVENADLYIKNLKIYRDSLAHKNEVDRYLKSIGYILDNLKKHIYSGGLLEFDSYYTRYKDNKIGFKEYTTYLIMTAGKRLIDIKSFSNIYLLSQTLEQEDKINFKTANNEKDKVVDKLKKVLSRNELEELITKVGQMKTEHISQADFYAYLVKKAKSIKLDLSVYPELQKYIVYISIYSAIDRASIAKEMDTLENRIAESMYENDMQRELGVLSKNLILEKNMFNISLTKDDYLYYTEHRASFAVTNFVKFIDKEAPLYKIQAKVDPDIARLDIYREKMEGFYECSLERDRAFVKNIKFTDHDRPNSIIITGGFHTQNLRELFKKENVSYISIMPKFVNEKGYESPYLKRLAGQRTALENVIDTAIPAVLNLATVEMLSSEIAVQVEGKANLNKFKLAILIMAAIKRGEEFKLWIPNIFIRPEKKTGDEDKVVTFTRGEGAELVHSTGAPMLSKPVDKITIGEANAYINGDNAEFVLVGMGAPAGPPTQISPSGAASGRHIPPSYPPPVKPGLIGKLTDEKGNIITSGLVIDVDNEANVIKISHGNKVMTEVNIATDRSGSKIVLEGKEFVGKLRKMVEGSKTSGDLQGDEPDRLLELIGFLERAGQVVALKPHDKVSGLIVGTALYLNQSLIDNPLGIIHELGESYLRIPEQCKYLTSHTAMRGAGADLRNAFKTVSKVNTKVMSPKIKSYNIVIEALEEKMKEKGFEMSDYRKGLVARGKSPITDSEQALIAYNFNMGRRGEQLLYGMQDLMDLGGNMRFTQNIRLLTDGYRQGVYNIFVMRDTLPTAAGQAAVGQEAARKFEKKLGTNISIYYFNDNKYLGERLALALNALVNTKKSNPQSLPRIFVNCQTPDDLKAVNEFKNKMRAEYPDIDELIAIGRDYEGAVSPEELPIVDEVTVMVVGSAIMNDRRLNKDFDRTPEELLESRRAMLSFLHDNKVISDEDYNSVIKTANAVVINLFMDEIWKGIRVLRCSRINWKEFDDWKNSQRQLLQAV